MIPYSQLRGRPRLPLVSRLPLSVPLSLYVETSNRCNFSCTMCPVSREDYVETVGGITSISLSAMAELFDDICTRGSLASLKLYGEGEPLLNKELPAVIQLAKAKGVAQRIEVTTNGSALTVATGAKLLETGLDYLRVSIYGISNEEQTRVTQSSVSADRILENVRAFKQLRDASGLKTPFLYAKIIDDGDASRSQAFVDRYSTAVDEVSVEPRMDWNGYEPLTLGRRAAQVTPSEEYPGHRKVCAFPFYSAVVKANGDVVACCVDWNKGTRVGNIHEERFSAIWDGSAMREFRRMQLEGRRGENPSCRRCSFLATCPDNLDDITGAECERVLGPEGTSG